MERLRAPGRKRDERRPNKRLIAAGDDIPDALWQSYEAETGETATDEDAVAESSDRSDEGR